jgi:hypothetical protein
MSQNTMLFAPCAFNLAETSRMLEIAKGIVREPQARKVFGIHFISDGGDFESLIEKHGFALTRMEPRLTPEKIEHIGKVDRGEKFTPAFTDAEMIQRVENEIAALPASRTGRRGHRVVPVDSGNLPCAQHSSRLGGAVHLVA